LTLGGFEERVMKGAQREVQWLKHIEGWKQSGLTQPRYCQRKSISYDTFKRWQQRLGTGGGLRGGDPGFVSVRVARANVARSMAVEPTAVIGRASAGEGVQIRPANGRAIALGAQLDAVELGRLIRLLEVLPC
jgi:hypothetical protein